MPDYFTLAEFRLLPNVASETKYPDTAVEAAADWAEAIIERETGTSFVARTVVDTLDGDLTADLILTSPFLISLTSVSVGGVAYTSPQLAALSFYNGVLRQPLGYTWAYGLGNIVVTYQAGYSAAPPADIKEAAMQAASYRLRTFYGDSGASERATSVSNETGTTSLAIADKKHPTGLPEVDATINAWADRLNVFGFA